jgi:hypothetical protein
LVRCFVHDPFSNSGTRSTAATVLLAQLWQEVGSYKKLGAGVAFTKILHGMPHRRKIAIDWLELWPKFYVYVFGFRV